MKDFRNLQAYGALRKKYSLACLPAGRSFLVLFGSSQKVQNLTVHRKIGHVLGPRGNVLTKERLTGFEHAMLEFEIDINSNWLIDGGEFSLEAGAQAARQFIELDELPTAIFCAADLIAMGLISEFAKHGISVPNDVSVIGFDDIAIAYRFIPSLTTIRQNRIQLGVLAATTLMNSLSGRSMPAENNVQLVDVLLVERESTAPFS